MSLLIKIIKYTFFIFGFYLAFAFAILPIFLSRKFTEFFEHTQEIIFGRNLDV